MIVVSFNLRDSFIDLAVNVAGEVFLFVLWVNALRGCVLRRGGIRLFKCFSG